MARRATLIDSLRALGTTVVVVDGGDFAEPNDPLAAEKTSYCLGELVVMGYDAVVPSRRDAERLSEGASGQLVLSNRTGTEPFTTSPHRIVRRHGWSVGVLALSDLDGAGDPLLAAKGSLDAFDRERVDRIVLLSQLPAEETAAVLDRHPEIDLVVMGHRTTRREGRYDGGALRVHPHPKGRAVHVVEFTRDAAVEPRVTRVLLDRRIPADPEVAVRVDSMVAKVNAARFRQRAP